MGDIQDTADLCQVRLLTDYWDLWFQFCQDWTEEQKIWTTGIRFEQLLRSSWLHSTLHPHSHAASLCNRCNHILHQSTNKVQMDLEQVRANSDKARDNPILAGDISWDLSCSASVSWYAASLKLMEFARFNILRHANCMSYRMCNLLHFSDALCISRRHANG